jgi:DNA modification methylase/ParB-like chromosome segregation protein Spo0J
MIQNIEKTKLKFNQYSFDIYGEFSFLKEDDLALQMSIKNEGILEPLIVSKSNMVISGNRRLFIAVYLTNITHVPVIITEIEDTEVDEYLIIQYNQQRVKNIVQVAREYELIRNQHGVKQGIKDKDAVELSKASQDSLLKNRKISESTIKRVLRIKKVKTEIEQTFNQNKNWNDEDSWKWILHQHTVRKKEVNSILKSVLDQHEEFNNAIQAESQPLFNSSSIHIIHGDSTDLSGILNDEQVDCIPNSPPYFGAVRTYVQDDIKVKTSTKGLQQTGHEETVDEYIDNLMKTYQECKRVLKNSGSIFINVADTIKEGEVQNVPGKIIDAMKKINLFCTQKIIWYKINPVYQKGKHFQPSMEYILHFVRDKKEYHWYDQWFGSEDEFLGDITYGDKDKKRQFKNVMIYYPPNPQSDNVPMYQGLLQTTVVNNNFLVKLLRSKGYELQHNALYPLEVPMVCILSTTQPGDTILDVFGGMSTTGLIAIANGCNYYGVDRSKVYSAQASIRIEDFLSNNPHLIKN